LTCRPKLSYLLNSSAPNLAAFPEAKVGVRLKPSPNKMTTAFIGGPEIYVHELQLPYELIYAWIHRFYSKIRKAGRKMMKLFPAQDQDSTICVATKEYVTESWKTVFIRTDLEPTPIVLAWRILNNGRGMWKALERPGSTSVISGGMGSYPVIPSDETNVLTSRMEPIGPLDVKDVRSAPHIESEAFGLGSAFVVQGSR
jgi:hypothetical protein